MSPRDCAAWFRVSGDDQRADNQIPDVEKFCQHHNLHIVRRFVLHDSAWRNGTGGPEYQAALKAMLDAAWRCHAGLARRKAEGMPIGRKPGAKDLKPRRCRSRVAP